MQKQKTISTALGILMIIIAVVIFFGGVFLYQYFSLQNKKQVASVNSWKTYVNNEYGFKITFPDSWKGYKVENSSWSGWKINGGAEGDFRGLMIVFKNPQTTPQQPWQDIPIMVFTRDVWKMVSGNNPTVAISAAPIGPEEVGENSKYVFATPPRWYGFTDAIGFQEAVNIIKTFSAFQIH